MMASTTNLIRIQSDLKDQVDGEYEFRNTWNGTPIITKEMADYSPVKSYLEKNNRPYFTFSWNSEKPLRIVIHHLPPDTLEEDISNSLEDIGFKVQQREANDGHKKGTQHTESRETPRSIPCCLNMKHKISRDIQAK
jgi:hypothetical protein